MYIMLNYIIDASATITGIVITEKTLVWATISEASAVSLSYLAQYIAVFVATGADAEIISDTSIFPFAPKSLKIKSIEKGIKISRKNEIK